MTVQLGRYGVWRSASGLGPELARDIEDLGYGAIWIGGSPGADLAPAEAMLAATERIAVATGIVNMWATPAEDVAAGYHRIAVAYPGRFLLGVGIGHPERDGQYRTPFATIVDYLDRLDRAGVPVEGRALAALGPKVLRVAAERTAGAHPYLVPAEHTRHARELLGAGVLLAPEHKVVLDPDPTAARELGRSTVRNYLTLRNYTANLLRHGFTDDDLSGEGSDALVDALVAHGDPATAAARLAEHLDAGADHVAVQPLGPGSPLPTLRALAGPLGLASA
jgi:probable F420-dependent oxidoreductase